MIVADVFVCLNLSRHEQTSTNESGFIPVRTLLYDSSTIRQVLINRDWQNSARFDCAKQNL